MVNHDISNGGFLLSLVKQVQSRVFDKLLTDAGIQEFNGAQGRILYVLWQEDNIPIIELSRKTGLAKTTLTSMLDRMETSGLVQRGYDSSDRRQILISLTVNARKLNNKYEKISQKMLEIYYAGLTDGEIKTFESVLNKILNNLNESEKNL